MDAVNQLRTADANIIGAVLNGRKESSGYYYYYGYYDESGKSSKSGKGGKSSKGGKKSAHDKNAVEVPYAPADANRGMSGVWGQRSK